MKAKAIRQTFLDFFKSKQHEIVSSAPIVLKDDPTLMFTNAGMNQFKDIFLGHGKIKSPKATDTQKCLRVSGKHNDLEEVGVDTYHHTMFEMLGNWSFGDYFKKEAIDWAWELLTEVYKIDKSCLYVTVFEGDKGDGLAFDQEAYDYWAKHIDEDRILNGNKKDNFWEMGEQGPCGPCSEIHVDIRSEEEKAKVPGKDLVNMDHPQVVEIWNLVFMQFNRKANGSLEELPAQHVDTGMGFERLAMVLQGVTSNYDTDVFTPLIAQVEKLSGAIYGRKLEIDVAIRVIVDHVRAVAFAIADGQLPSNTGAGYVIRRILRRAVRYGFTFLNLKEAFIYKLVQVLVDEMGEAFPEIKSQQRLIENVIREEEVSFLRTLEQGLVRLDQIIKATEGDLIDGSKVFELYDTYGFPVDLTALILSEQGKSLNEADFEKEMARQKDRSRSAAKVETDDWVVLFHDDKEEFVGYDYTEVDVKIAKYRKVKKKNKELYHLVFQITPFYAESGGQVGDTGVLEGENGNATYIIDTIKENDLTIHVSETLPAHVDATFTAKVNVKARNLTARNHSATHLLHHALREVLGDHVEQKGSMVNPKGLRFDFAHFSKMTDKEIAQVEKLVNEKVVEGIALEEQRNVPIGMAKQQGVTALFGEKYGDLVRTIRFGESFELCGGTHVPNTTDIRLFKLVSEGAVAAGVRRIEAITSDAAEEFFYNKLEELEAIKAVLKNAVDPVKAISNLQKENAALKKEVEQLVKEKAGSLKDDLKKSAKNINGVNFISAKVGLDAGAIKTLAFELNGEMENMFLVLGAEVNGKAILTVMISKDLAEAKDLNAGAIIRDLGKEIQGGGGGQAFFATAGGKNPAGIENALAKAETIIA